MLNGGVKNIFNSYQNDFDKGEFRDAEAIFMDPLIQEHFSWVLKL